MMKHIDDKHIGFLKHKYLGNDDVQPEFKCKNCDLKTENSAELEAHEKEIHSIILACSEGGQKEDISLQESVLICGACAKSFENESEFKEHICSHTTPNSFNCFSCGSTFHGSLDLEWHNETEHKSQIYNQYLEPQIFLRPETESISCHFCSEVFKHHASLETHIEKEHTVNTSKHQVEAENDLFLEQNEICFKCEKCIFVGNASELEEHTEAKHVSLISCKDCGTNFSSTDILKEHKARKHNVKTFPCDICGLVFANFIFLQEHRIAIHKDESCRYCDYRAKNKEDLEEHLVYQHEEYIILHSLAKEVDKINEQFSTVETFGKQLSTYETFMTDILSVLKSLLEGQNAMKQELFILQNSHHIKNQKNLNKTDIHTKVSPPASPSNPSPKASSSSSSGPRASTPKPQSQLLFIGDSITNALDTKVIAQAADAKITKVKAYSAVHDDVSNTAKQAAKIPHQNVTNVCEKELAKNEFDGLILQAGSVDISNLNTRNNATEHFEYFSQETTKSAENVFQVAESSLKNHPNLKKVVIMKQIPRYDTEQIDPLQIKPALSEVYNNKLSDLWLHSTMKEKIFVGSHDRIACTGGIREARYRCTQSGRFDGVHLYGPSGMKTYTNSVLEILRNASLIPNDSLSCPQFQYQNRNSDSSQDKRCFSWVQDRDVRRKNTRSGTYKKPSSNIRNFVQKQDAGYATYNRYEVLSDSYQGNF